MRKFTWIVLTIIFFLNNALIKAEYYPYPLMINHGRGDNAKTFQLMRDYLRQYYPQKYFELNPVTSDGTEKPIFTYSVSDYGQRADLWTMEMFGRNFGLQTGKIINNETDEEKNNEVNPPDIISLQSNEPLCWLEEAKRNFLTLNIPENFELGSSNRVYVDIHTNSKKEVTGATYTQNSTTETINISDMPFFNKYTFIAHSTGCPVTRRYITASSTHEFFPYKDDVWKLVTLGGVNAGSNWGLSYNSISQMQYWIGPALLIMGAQLLPIDPGTATYILISGGLYIAVSEVVSRVASYDVDADLKPDSLYVERDLSSSKPKNVKYRNVVGTGYPVPDENDLEALFHAFNAMPLMIGTLQWYALIPELGTIGNFFWLHGGFQTGDGIMQEREQRGIRPAKFLHYDETINEEIYNAPYVKVNACHSRAAIWNYIIHQSEGFISEAGPGKGDEIFNGILKMIDDVPILSSTNTLTTYAMEPDGVYVNIQNPEIHPDGTVDDYFVPWMGDHNRVRLYYDDYTNIKIPLTIGSEGYQRNGDVGRGWFSDAHSLIAGGENRIRVKAYNAANQKGNDIARTYYSVGINSPQDGTDEINMASPLVYYTKDNEDKLEPVNYM